MHGWGRSQGSCDILGVQGGGHRPHSIPVLPSIPAGTRAEGNGGEPCVLAPFTFVGFSWPFLADSATTWLSRVLRIDLYDSSRLFTPPIGKEECSYIAKLTWADKTVGMNAKVRDLFCNRKLLGGIC